MTDDLPDPKAKAAAAVEFSLRSMTVNDVPVFATLPERMARTVARGLVQVVWPLAESDTLDRARWAVHAVRFDHKDDPASHGQGVGGPDSFYNGVLHAEHTLRDLGGDSPHPAQLQRQGFAAGIRMASERLREFAGHPPDILTDAEKRVWHLAVNAAANRVAEVVESDGNEFDRTTSGEGGPGAPE